MSNYTTTVRKLAVKRVIMSRVYLFVLGLMLNVVHLVAQPTITSFTPTSGPIGTEVTITGTNFSSTSSNNIVYFGATKANVSAATTTSLTVTVPAGATYQPVSVLTNELIGYSSMSFVVTYSPTGAINTNSFDTKQDHTVGSSTRSIYLGDLDGDGKPDIVVANQDDNSISVLRNTSDVTNISYASPVTCATGATPRSVIIADLDCDGKLDLAIANWGSNSVSVLRNNSLTAGTIALEPKDDFVSGDNPYSITSGDFDSDGKVDLAIANIGNETISILRNTSTGAGNINYASKVDYATGLSPISISAGELDGDSKIDLVVTNLGSNTISVFKNTSTIAGDISFGAKVDYLTGNSPWFVSIGDLDGDDKADLAVSNMLTHTLSIYKNISPGAGAIAYNDKLDYAIGVSPRSVAISDLDGNGKPDLVASNYSGNTISILKNTNDNIGTISFSTRSEFTTGFGPYAVAIGDLNNDQRPDLVVGNDGASSISTFKNVMSAASNKTEIIEFSMAVQTGPATIDFENKTVNVELAYDTDVSALISTFVLSSGANAKIGSVNQISGETINDFTTSINYTITAENGFTMESWMIFVTVAALRAPVISSFAPIEGPVGTSVKITGTDFNPIPSKNIVFFGTIQAEVITSSGTELIVKVPSGTNYQPITILNNELLAYSNTPFTVTFEGNKMDANSFGNRVDFDTGNNPWSISIGDLDGDGKEDLAVANNGSDVVSIYRNIGVNTESISYADPVDFSTGIGPISVAMGDADGDGKLDLAIANYSSSSVSVLRNLSTLPGTINFATRADYSVGAGSYPRGVAFGELDGDGKTDIIVSNFGGNKVSVFRNSSSSAGTVSYEARVDYAIGSDPWNISIRDLDGDSKSDFVVVNRSSHTISIFRNNSAGVGSISFEPKIDYATGSYPYSVAIGDLDADEKLDIVVVNNGSNSISLFKNSSLGPGSIDFDGEINYTTGEQPQWVSLDDLNGDGKIDLAVTNKNSKSVSVFENDGVTPGVISFGSKIDFYVRKSPFSISTGDLNGDGKPDLAIGNYGNSISLFMNIDYSNILPDIVSFTPKKGTVGSEVTIEGVNFDPVANNNIVYFGAVQAVVTDATSNVLKVIVPRGATHQPITVLVNDFLTSGPNPYIVTDEGEEVIDGNLFKEKYEFLEISDNLTEAYPIVTADFDGDGILDLATGDTGMGLLSVFKNTTIDINNLSFATKIDYSAGFPSSFIACDLDADGKLDLVVANQLSSSISVFRNASGTGTIDFESKIDFNVENGPSMICAADFDKDGRLDLAITNPQSNLLSILRNVTETGGIISFDSKLNFVTGSSPQSVAVGNFDDDELMDLVVVNNSDHTLSIFENRSSIGNINFDLSQTLNTAAGPIEVITGYIDQDEMSDIVVTNKGSNSISIFRNATIDNDLISFADRSDIVVGSGPSVTAITDLDGDGFVDLAVVNQNENTISLIKNNTNGTDVLSFDPKVDLITGESPVSISAGDLNQDKFPDLIVANLVSHNLSYFENAKIDINNSPPTISSFSPANGPIGTEVTITGTNFDATPANNIVFFGATKAAVTAATTTSLTVTVPAGATYEPITVLVDGLIAYSQTPFVVTFEGGGTIDANSFDAKVDFNSVSNSWSVSIGDLNLDGKLDLVVGSTIDNQVSILRNETANTGTVSFGAMKNITIANIENSWSSSIGDFDGDGKPDMVIANSYITNNVGSSISVFENIGNESIVINFAEKLEFLTGGRPWSIATGDMDKDGKTDLVIANAESNTISILRNTSTGGAISFSEKQDFPTGSSPYGVSIGDLDGDDNVDIVVANRNDKSISIFRNISTGVGSIEYAAKIDFTSGNDPFSVKIGDLNKDNLMDIAVVNKVSSTISVFKNSSSGIGSINFETKVDFNTGLGPSSLAICDLDGDSKMDLVTANLNGSSISLFRNTSSETGDIHYSSRVDITAGDDPSHVVAGDLDSDGKPDLVVANFNRSYVSVFRNAIASAVSSNETDFTTYSFPEQIASPTIDTDNHTISIEVASGTDLTSLVATFTLSSGATTKANGTTQISGTTANDFSSQVNYTVTSEDGSTSQVWTVTVTVAGSPIISNIIAADSYLIGSGGYTITATITDNVNLSDVQIFAKKTSETDYTATAINISGDNYSGTFTDSAFGDLGLTFYIEATDSEGNKTTSVQYSVKTVKEGDIEAITELKSSNDQLDYAMIAIPYEVQGVASVFSNLGAHANNEWRLAHYNGGVGYQYYPVDFSNFEPGKGYWFLTSRPTDFSIKGGSAVQASDSEPFTIQLRANDWNMIGNPYPFAIDWQAVIDYNANNGRTVEKLVTYTNRQYNSDQTALGKYDGALLHSSTAMEIQIPVSAKSSSSGRSGMSKRKNDLQNFGTGEWDFSLSIRNETIAYDVSSISMKEGAEVGKDPYDWKRLPRLSSYLDISFQHGITKSAVPIAQDYTWDFMVNSNLVGELTTLEWDNKGLEDSGHGLMLLDVKNYKIVDMSRRSFYQFKFEEESHNFKLFYAAKNKLSEYLKIGTNFIGDPFPNPFSHWITLPLSIDDPNGTVQIKLYNILGKEVYQSFGNKLSAGYHEFNINMKNEVKTAIKAGAYLMQVTLTSDTGVQRVNKRILYNK